MTRSELTAWAAGLFEGEGTWHVRPNRKYAQMAVAMRDRDVVERFAAWAGCGNVTLAVRTVRNPEHSDIYHWQIAARKDVLRVTQELLPFLGERRKAKALEVIEIASQVDGRSLRYANR